MRGNNSLFVRLARFLEYKWPVCSMLILAVKSGSSLGFQATVMVLGLIIMDRLNQLIDRSFLSAHHIYAMLCLGKAPPALLLAPLHSTFKIPAHMCTITVAMHLQVLLCYSQRLKSYIVFADGCSVERVAA